MFKLTMKDLCEHITSIITVGGFYQISAGEGSQIIFTWVPDAYPIEQEA